MVPLGPSTRRGTPFSGMVMAIGPSNSHSTLWVRWNTHRPEASPCRGPTGARNPRAVRRPCKACSTAASAENGMRSESPDKAAWTLRAYPNWSGNGPRFSASILSSRASMTDRMLGLAPGVSRAGSNSFSRNRDASRSNRSTALDRATTFFSMDTRSTPDSSWASTRKARHTQNNQQQQGKGDSQHHLNLKSNAHGTPSVSCPRG